MSQSDGFYVGYLPMPRRHMLFLWIIAPLLAGALGALAGVFSASQRDPGSGTWDTGAPVSVEGTLLAEPYPMIIDDQGRIHLLVNFGKTAPRDRLVGITGGRARVLGYTLEREGRRMLELVSSSDAVVPRTGTSRSVALEQTNVSITRTGEILDSKCYLGAMKPGDGKGHKACATQCITGGIPPLLCTWTGDGTKQYYLLIDSQGRSARELIVAYVGEPVAVTGRLGRIGDLETLAVGPQDIGRLVY